MKVLALPSVFTWRPTKRQWQAVVKGMTSYLISSIIFIITPVTEYFGSLGYLCIIMAIFTPPFLPLGSHVESFALATVGMGIGLGFSAIGQLCFTIANRNVGVPSGRWVAFAFILLVAFLFGVGKAKYPKLAVMWTIGLIPPLYIFTTHVDELQFSFVFPSKFILLQLLGCFITLLVNAVLWPVSSTVLVCNTIVSSLSQARNILSKLPDALRAANCEEIEGYQLEAKIKSVRATMCKLADMFRQARYEITYGRIDPRQIVRSVGSLVKLQHRLRILLRTVLDAQRMRFDSEVHRSVNINIEGVNRHNVSISKTNEKLIHQHLNILVNSTSGLISNIVVVMNRLVQMFELLNDQHQPVLALPQEQLPCQVPDEIPTRQLIEEVLSTFDEIHMRIIDELHTTSEGTGSNDSILIASAFVYSLKQVIFSVKEIVDSQEEMSPKFCKRKRFWWPKVSFYKWLHADTHKEKEIRGHIDTPEDEDVMSEDEQDDILFSASQDDCPGDSFNMKEVDGEKESHEDGIRRGCRGKDSGSSLDSTLPECESSSHPMAPQKRTQSIGTFLYEKQKTKESKRTFRYIVWKSIQWWKSNEIVYALKFTLIFGCLSLPAYFDTTLAWYSANHGQWSLITANIVSNITIGAVFTIGIQRFVGTLLGGLWGLVIWEISRANQYALPVCFAIMSFPLWYLFVHNSANKVGSVSLAAYVVVIFNEWVYQRSGQKVAIIALKRIAAVDAGILATFIVHSLIAPYIARVELRAEISHIFNLNTQVLSSLFNLHNDEDEEDHILEELKLDFTKLYHSLLTAQELFDKSSAEPRLRGPFQRKVYEQILIRLQHMLDLTLIVRGTLSQLPPEYHEKYMVPINEFRRELVSILILNLYNLSGALRTKSPMPRYLPSVTAIRQIIYDYTLRELPHKSRRSFLVTIYYTYAWALLEFSIEEEIIIELVKGIVGENKLNLKLNSNRSTYHSNQLLLFQNKQPHQLKFE